jgi:MYXO-CTERM domain-containing protein
VEGCCRDSGECDDGDACTDDACADHACIHTLIPGCPAGPADAGTGPDADAGANPGTDARPLDPDGSAAADAGPGDGATRAYGGCACTASGQRSPLDAGLVLGLLGLLGLGWRARRRSAPSASRAL